MEKTPSYLAVESLMDLCKKAGIAKGREFMESESYCFYRNFSKLSWYSRVNINSMPQKNERMLAHIKELCTEENSPKYLSLAKEDMYEGFETDLDRMDFVFVKPQKGMLYDLKTAPVYDEDDNIVEVTEENLADWIDTCEKGFNKSGTSEDFNLFFKDKNCHFYGYVKDGRIVTTALLNVCGRNGGIHEVTTLEEYRGRGFAPALVKHIINEAKKHGCDMLSLQASVYGEPVYKKLGFNIVSSIMNYRI